MIGVDWRTRKPRRWAGAFSGLDSDKNEAISVSAGRLLHLQHGQMAHVEVAADRPGAVALVETAQGLGPLVRRELGAPAESDAPLLGNLAPLIGALDDALALRLGDTTGGRARPGRWGRSGRSPRGRAP
jgi:hypothetical protein